MKNKNVVAVIVTYNPCFIALDKLVEAVSPQVGGVVLVDNDSSLQAEILVRYSKIHQAEFVRLKENFGIAYAHNKGIEWAHDNGADYVLILDQDSVPATDMVHLLLTNALNSTKKGAEVAAIGPSYEDPRTKTHSFFMTSRFGFPHRYKPQQDNSPKKTSFGEFLN